MPSAKGPWMRSSYDLLAISESDFAKGFDVHLGINLGGVRRSMADKVADRFEREPRFDKALNASMAQRMRARP